MTVVPEHKQRLYDSDDGRLMSIVMQLSMRSMFPSSRLNAVIGIGAALAFIASFAAMRIKPQSGMLNSFGR